MNTLQKVSLVLSLPLLVASCMSSHKLEKRYKSITTRNYPATKDSIKYFVSVSGYSSAPASKSKTTTPAPAKNIFSLSGEGQKQLIEAIAENEDATDDIFSKMAQDIIPAAKPAVHTSGVGRRFTKRVVFAVDDMHLTPADKVQKLTISLMPAAGSNIKVISCNKINNNYKGAAASSVINGDGLVVVISNPNGNDLTGNITAEVVCEYSGAMAHATVFTTSNLWTRDLAAAKPAAIQLKAHQSQNPVSVSGEEMTLDCEAIVSHVTKGDNTISTSDDVVELIKGKTTANPIRMVKAASMKPTYYQIGYNDRHLELGGDLYQGPLTFPTYAEAEDFMRWLKRSAADLLANNRISGGDYKLTISGDSNVLTDSFIDNCKISELH